MHVVATLIALLLGRPSATPSSARDDSLESFLQFRTESEEPLPDESALLERLGPGCVSEEVLDRDVPWEIHHCYHDRERRTWYRWTVEVGGPESRDVVGALVSSVRLCSRRCRLGEDIAIAPLFGLRLGDTFAGKSALVGEPLRTSEVTLGRLRGTRAWEFAPGEPGTGLIVTMYTHRCRIVALGFAFQE